MSQFDEKAALQYGYDQGWHLYDTRQFVAGARWQHSQDAAKIAELEAEVEALIIKGNRWREMAEANEDRLLLFEESIRHSFKEREDQLAEKLRIATEALEEASEWNRVDDVNGEAGRIAKQALEKLKSE